MLNYGKISDNNTAYTKTIRNIIQDKEIYQFDAFDSSSDSIDYNVMYMDSKRIVFRLKFYLHWSCSGLVGWFMYTRPHFKDAKVVTVEFAYGSPSSKPAALLLLSYLILYLVLSHAKRVAVIRAKILQMGGRQWAAGHLENSVRYAIWATFWKAHILITFWTQ